jgi:hypothetical protein
MEIQAPEPLAYPASYTSIFLAGSIEMGIAEKWQDRIVRELSGLPAVLFNPRRESWDISWKQGLDNPKFVEQVNWELDALDEADIILVYIDPNTKSPITLMELGIHAKSNKMIVCCPEGFWRKGNVDIVCQRYNIPCVENLSDLIEKAKTLLV